MAELTRSRRSALKTIGWFLAGAAGLWRFLTPRGVHGGEPSRQLVAIPAGEIPADGALVLPQHGLAVVREGSALLALDLACTHLGCTVTATGSGFACPCHGSRFSSRGERVAGPASDALCQIHLEEKNGVVRVGRTPELVSALRGSPAGDELIGRG